MRKNSEQGTLIEAVDLAEAIGNMTKQLCSDKLSDPESVEALMACRLIPRDKNPELRPIGIGEVLRRIIGKAVSRTLRTDIQSAAGSPQLRAGQECGCEAAIHAMVDVFEDDETRGVIQVDANNAFDSINRNVLLHNIEIICPELSIYTKNSYMKPARLFVTGGIEITSKEGTTQGDSIAMPYTTSLHKKTWSVMKEIIGKSKLKSTDFPRRLNVDNLDIYEDNDIANSFNNFFIGIGPNLANKIENARKPFESYINETNIHIENTELTYSEMETAFFSIKKNKASGYDKISSDVVLSCYDEIKNVLFHIFDKSLSNGIFPDNLKIAKVTPIFKIGDESLLMNYRPISVLPVFSKILERIMYNRTYKYLTENKLLYAKQFGFQRNSSTEHAILQLTNDISEAFDSGKLTLGIFIDLSKAFDTEIMIFFYQN